MSGAGISPAVGIAGHGGMPGMPSLPPVPEYHVSTTCTTAKVLCCDLFWCFVERAVFLLTCECLSE